MGAYFFAVNTNYTYPKKGQAALIAVLLMFAISLASVFGTMGIALKERKAIAQSVKSNAAYFAAESGIEDVLYRLKRNKQLGSTVVISLDGAYATTTITTLGNQKQIDADGKNKDTYRSVQAIAAVDTGVSFSFALQAGEDGIGMGNGASIIGNVYSNGSINGANGSVITGWARVAGGQAVEAQSYTAVSPSNIVVGQSNNPPASYIDVAEPFQFSATTSINQVAFRMMKVGSPADRTVRILANGTNGKPSNNSLSDGTLFSATVPSGSVGWVNVTLDTVVTLSPNTTYWLCLDTANNTSNYYQVELGNSDGLVGVAQYSAAYSSGQNSWTTITGNKDFSYKIFSGDFAANEIKSMVIYGDAYAHTIDNSNIQGNAYYQVIDQSSLDWLNAYDGGFAYATTVNQPIQPFPISEVQIEDWKTIASTTRVTNCTSPYRPAQNEIMWGLYNCDVSINDNRTVYFKHPVWVNGDINIGNSVDWFLATSSGATSGVILASGTATSSATMGNIHSGNGFRACGSLGYNTSTNKCDTSNGSYTLLVATYSGTSASAVGLANGIDGAVIYAPYGKFHVGNGVKVNTVAAKRISLANNASIEYETGLVTVGFPASQGGTWNITSWQEVQP